MLWKDYPDTSTPITAAALNDLENRVTQAYKKGLTVETAVNSVKSRINALEAATTGRTTGWMTLTLGTGWTAVTGHTPRARLLNGLICVEGAVLRGSGGNPASMVQLPTILSSLLRSGSQFIGATTAARNGTAAACELYVSNTGWVSMATYTQIDSGTGWIVPLSAVFAPGA